MKGKKEIAEGIVEQALKFLGNIGRDNPALKRESGKEWLAEKQRYSGPKGIRGADTAWTREPVDMPLDLLSGVKGARDETRVPGDPQYDDLLAKVQQEGWNPDPISIVVNHRGEPFIYEGNTRSAVGRATGQSTVPAEIHWMNGAEMAPGQWSPEALAEFLANREKQSGGRAGYGPGGVIDDIVKMAGKIVSGADEPAKTGIRAYQGSPHNFAAERLVRFPDKTEQYIVGTPDVLPDVPEGAEVIQDFPLGRMRMDKIGTGEGAQAYGHGLYAAEAEDVAQGYRQRLANVDASEADKIGIPPNYWNAFTMFAKQADETQAEAAARDFANWTGLDLTPDLVRAFDNTLKSRGRMYEVSISADPNTFLDWDKPLSEQPAGQKLIERNISGAIPPEIEIQARVKGLDPREHYRSLLGSMTGGDFARSEAGNFGGQNAASRRMREAGIPGIKYLDAGSRGAGEGTRNYVVFDDRLISIIRKYGIAGASAMLGYNLMEQLDPKQALAASMADQDYQSSVAQKAYGGEVDDDIDDALRIAKDVGGSTPVMMEDAKGNKYDAQGNIIPPTAPGPNPARSDATPQSVAAKAVNDPATYDALMERYAVPDRDIAEYEALRTAVSQQPQAVQQMTHVGDRPRREMKIDMPLFGGEYSMGTAPYDVAEGMQGAAQTAYDFKTMPAYFFPPTAPFALGADVLESRIKDDPLGLALNLALTPQGFSAAKSAVDLVRRNPKATAAAVGAGAYLTPDEAEAGPERWFSKAMEVARAIPMEKMTGQQALAMLRKSVSPEELRWTGTDVFLSNTPKISKDELLDYLKNNRFQTEDVALGGNKPTKREEVRPSETARAPFMEDWNALKAKRKALDEEYYALPVDEQTSRQDEFWQRQFQLDTARDALKSKMVDATIKEMGGLGLPVQYGPGSRFGDQYVTRGGEGYGEDLYKMPNAMRSYNSYVKQLREKYGESALDDMPLTVSERGTLDNLMEAAGDERKVYTSSHFPQYPGYLAHTRSQMLNVEPPGANRPYKAWNMEEAQSDLAKSGRKSGFYDPVVYQKWVNDYYKNEKIIEQARDQLQIAAERVEEILGPEPNFDVSNFYNDKMNSNFNNWHEMRQDALNNDPSIVEARKKLNDAIARGRELEAAMPNTQAAPIGPFVKSMEGWSKLAIKKQLDKALDGGADYFTWTPGEAQAERYSLSKVADNITYNAPFVSPSGKSYPGRLVATKNGSQVFAKEGVTPEKLPEFIGKELADRINANKTIVEEGPMKGWEKSSISGDELKFGGEGMRKYYDSAFVKYVQDVFKEATGEKPNIEVITAQTADGPRQQLGIRLTDEMREKARFSDFNKGGRVSNPVVNKALQLTRDY